MGKRSDFKRIERDFYQTPAHAVAPLIPFLSDVQTYCEPCAGQGALVDHLSEVLECVAAYDVLPLAGFIEQADALSLTAQDMNDADFIITNPPWQRSILHPMIEHFSSLKPTWLLFDADWMHTKQSEPYLPLLRKIVSIGRVKWFDNVHGKDNSCWYLFDRQEDPNPPRFYGRSSCLTRPT